MQLTRLNPLRLAGLALFVSLYACTESVVDTPVDHTRYESLENIADEGRYIVLFAPGAASEGRAATGTRGSVVREIHGLSGVAAILSAGAAEALARNPNILLVERDPVRLPLAAPPEQTPYGIEMVQAPLLSDEFTGQRKLCIIDSGYDAAHPDLPLTEVSGNSDPNLPWDEDGCGHGTHVAGTIAALANGQGVVGVNPSGALKIHVERVFGDNCGWAYASDLISAANRCADAGAHVISMSLGCSTAGRACYSAAEEAAFAALARPATGRDGILSVAAASNDGRSWYAYPASYDSVVSVAALDSRRRRAWFSNYNDQVELAAPGVDVLSTVPLGCHFCESSTAEYEMWSGTSMATPHVAAVAALVWSFDPTLTNEELRQLLGSTALDLGASGRDNDTGFGLVQAKAAVDALGSAPPVGCVSDADCDDICCDGACVAAACTAGSCDDADVCTTDTCENAGTCAASCVAAPITGCEPPPVCGNGICEGNGEDGLTCSTDCRCAGGRTCKKGNCGDGVCNGNESTRNCSIDCG